MFYELTRGRAEFMTLEELQNDYVMYGIPKQRVEECTGNLYNFRSDIYVSKELVFVVLDLASECVWREGSNCVIH